MSKQSSPDSTCDSLYLSFTGKLRSRDWHGNVQLAMNNLQLYTIQRPHYVIEETGWFGWTSMLRVCWMTMGSVRLSLSLVRHNESASSSWRVTRCRVNAAHNTAIRRAAFIS